MTVLNVSLYVYPTEMQDEKSMSLNLFLSTFPDIDKYEDGE